MYRNHPYRRPQALLRLPVPKTGTALDAVYQRWNAIVASGQLPTYNHETGSVNEIMRPMVEVGNRLVPAGAAAIDATQLFCPCTKPNGDRCAHLVLKRKQGTHDVFEAPAGSPQCVFRIPVPKTRQRRTFNTQAEVDAWYGTSFFSLRVSRRSPEQKAALWSFPRERDTGGGGNAWNSTQECGPVSCCRERGVVAAAQEENALRRSSGKRQRRAADRSWATLAKNIGRFSLALAYY
ncbi:hypothetical protein HMN09_01095100 [Mycena chlorophos]|uniref:Uncharacterized protein n=1 Tax=Mycena chlorophos TaxID=658473 RepID=A0A8H6SC86_MYCCL|nr:hypothetical protein HMN09_01095100 [Mycena chlorophos]